MLDGWTDGYNRNIRYIILLTNLIYPFVELYLASEMIQPLGSLYLFILLLMYRYFINIFGQEEQEFSDIEISNGKLILVCSFKGHFLITQIFFRNVTKNYRSQQKFYWKKCHIHLPWFPTYYLF